MAEREAIARAALSFGICWHEPVNRYVAVDAHMATDGTVTPQRIYWKGTANATIEPPE